ncbi:MAG: FAD-dependent oxidoreductase [Candidatus Zixiibacteriota bacterium]
MLTVDGNQIEAERQESILNACLKASIYIPHLCSHPAVPTACDGDGCGLCLVNVNGNPEPVRACKTLVETADSVVTQSDTLTDLRQKTLAHILATHPHACLTCHEAEGCSRTQCSQNVDSPDRCCSLFGNCPVRKVSASIGIPPYTTRYVSQGMPKLLDELFYAIDPNLCISCDLCVRACRDVKKIDALAMSDKYGRSVALPKATTLKESGCIFCGLCVEVCPTGALMDKPWSFETRDKSVVPCRATCPAEIDVPTYVRLVAEKRYGEAVAVIREKAPIPGVLGRVCYTPCETGCRRKVWDEPVAIRSLKRFAADNDDGHWSKHLTCKADSGKRVSVVGAGPAGLSAAYYLRILGHSVDLYDRMEWAGGMLRYGIPRYRLPANVLDDEVEAILNLGVTTHFGTNISSPDQLTECDAVFWCTGAARSVALPKGVCGDDSIADGLGFLKRLNSGERTKLSGRVAVIGGGNVATDVARSAIRLGATSVVILYRRTREEMPAYDSEIDEAIAERIELQFLCIPSAVSRTAQGIEVTIQRMKLGNPDESGRRAPVPVEGDSDQLIVDHLFSAIGQRVEAVAGLEVTEAGTLRTDAKTLATSQPGLFAGGDNITGPSSVVAAVEAGRLAAQSIDRYLGGNGELPSYNIRTSSDLAAESDTSLSLETAPCLKNTQESGFEEIEQAYSESVAVGQASRCSRCDLRLSIPAVTLPPERYQPFDIIGIGSAPSETGVVTLYDAQMTAVLICGADDMRAELESRLKDRFSALWYSCEPHQMYTQRESELLSEHLQKHGSLPPGNDLEDDLF